ncbi:uncharacterized protein [Cicer arietinum]|uniref:Uncharacterized protein LOC101511154 n=1 Tax=Cicer arietinum TaxID=3827 RepID=A0A1S2YL66_CICAR|nr:uncharacterized protein LOC101511154 [Cicer arietinum]
MAAEDSDSDYVLLMATTNEEHSSSQFWFLDTGCSNHMIRHKEWFVSLDERIKREIKFADNSKVTAEGVGNVMIRRREGNQSFICDVLYVPRLMKNNLVSLGQLLEKGYSIRWNMDK